MNQATVLVTAVVSSVMFILGSMVFFIFGYICGYNRKQRRTADVIGATQPIQIYEEIHQPSTIPVTDQDVELNENVAYGSVNP